MMVENAQQSDLELLKPLNSLTSMASSSKQSQNNCSVCPAPAIYKCPKCSARTCSVDCTKAHKQEQNCDGQRPTPTSAAAITNQQQQKPWRPIVGCSQFREDSHGLQDQRFLHGLATAVQAKIQGTAQAENRSELVNIEDETTVYDDEEQPTEQRNQRQDDDDIINISSDSSTGRPTESMSSSATGQKPQQKSRSQHELTQVQRQLLQSAQFRRVWLRLDGQQPDATGSRHESFSDTIFWQCTIKFVRRRDNASAKPEGDEAKEAMLDEQNSLVDEQKQQKLPHASVVPTIHPIVDYGEESDDNDEQEKEDAGQTDGRMEEEKLDVLEENTNLKVNKEDESSKDENDEERKEIPGEDEGKKMTKDENPVAEAKQAEETFEYLDVTKEDGELQNNTKEGEEMELRSSAAGDETMVLIDQEPAEQLPPLEWNSYTVENIPETIRVHTLLRQFMRPKPQGTVISRSQLDIDRLQPFMRAFQLTPACQTSPAAASTQFPEDRLHVYLQVPLPIGDVEEGEGGEEAMEMRYYPVNSQQTILDNLRNRHVVGHPCFVVALRAANEFGELELPMLSVSEQRLMQAERERLHGNSGFNDRPKWQNRGGARGSSFRSRGGRFQHQSSHGPRGGGRGGAQQQQQPHVAGGPIHGNNNYRNQQQQPHPHPHFYHPYVAASNFAPPPPPQSAYPQFQPQQWQQPPPWASNGPAATGGGGQRWQRGGRGGGGGRGRFGGQQQQRGRGGRPV